MSKSTFTLFAAASGDWRIGCADASGCRSVALESVVGETLASAAARVYDALLEQGYSGEGTCLAIPSEWCLAASIEVDDLPNKNRRGLMLYRLEEKLPLAAEELVIDFAPARQQSLGVASTLQRLQPLVDALEVARIAISHVCPAAMLALQAALPGRAEGDVFLFQTGQSIDAFGVKNSCVLSWHHIAEASSGLQQNLRWHAFTESSPRRVVACGLCDSDFESIGRLGAVASVSPIAEDPLSLASTAADAMLRGRSEPWLNLRRDALATQDAFGQIRRPLSVAMVAVVVFCIGVSIALLWRASQYQQLTDAAAAQQVLAFAEALPGKPLPANVKSRLASEERKLRGVSGEAGRLPEHLSALLLMYDTMQSLPRDLRYQLLEMRFTGDRLYLEGQARSHGDAELIASSLHKMDALQVEAPQSEQRADNSVSFSLSAALKSATPAEGAGR